MTIMFSQTLGTALGDWIADIGGLGYDGGALVFAAAAGGRRRALFLDERLAHAAVLGGVHPDAAARRDVVGDFLDKPRRRRRAGAEPLLCVGACSRCSSSPASSSFRSARAPSGRGRAGSRAGVRQAALMSVLVDRLRTQSLRPFVPMLDAAAPAIPVQRVGSPRDEPLCVSAPPDRRLRCPRERGAAPLLIQVSKYWMPCWARLHRLTYLAREAIPAVRA